MFLSNENERLTIHIRTACSGGVFSDSIPRQTLKSACFAAIDSCKSQLFIGTQNISCFLPYPVNIWGRISSCIAVKSHVMTLND